METIESLIARVSDRLDKAGLYFGHGTDNPVDEAHWLVLHLLNLPVDQPVEDYSTPVSTQAVAMIDNVLTQRIEQRLPLAYLLNSAWFAGLEFYVDERVLIPRSPLAELILDGFREWLDPYRVQGVLDLCCGSGCIGIACSYAFPEANIVATDISADALAVAQINKEKHCLSGHLKLLESDVFSNVNGKFDLIISNPPYVDQAEMEALLPEFRHEPALGLAAGSDGLQIVDTILQQATNYLSDEGILVVEVGNSAPQLEEKYAHLPFLWIDFESGGSGVFILTARELRLLG